jgi:acetyltransferase-like isoleucine patch superfamily enzyme
MISIWRKINNQIDRFYRAKNRMILRRCGAVVGCNADLVRNVVIECGRNGTMNIGDNFVFRSGNFMNPLSRGQLGHICVNDDAVLVIGNDVGISSSCIWAHKSIMIGDRATIGANVSIVDSDCHSIDYRDRGTRNDMLNKRDLPIVIGCDVLIGAGAIVLKGVTIGARTVIGAGSIVSKNIPPDVVAAGNPCRVIHNLDFFQKRENDGCCIY